MANTINIFAQMVIDQANGRTREHCGDFSSRSNTSYDDNTNHSNRISFSQANIPTLIIARAEIHKNIINEILNNPNAYVSLLYSESKDGTISSPKETIEQARHCRVNGYTVHGAITTGKDGFRFTINSIHRKEKASNKAILSGQVITFIDGYEVRISFDATLPCFKGYGVQYKELWYNNIPYSPEILHQGFNITSDDSFLLGDTTNTKIVVNYNEETREAFVVQNFNGSILLNTGVLLTDSRIAR